jgi:hypothetical protein
LICRTYEERWDALALLKILTTPCPVSILKRNARGGDIKKQKQEIRKTQYRQICVCEGEGGYRELNHSISFRTLRTFRYVFARENDETRNWGNEYFCLPRDPVTMNLKDRGGSLDN